MICKKCKTAVSETDTKCSYCGAKIKRGKNYFLIVLLIILAILAAIIYWFTIGGGKLPKDTDPTPTTSPEITQPITTEAPIVSETPIASETPQEPQMTTEPAPTYSPDLEKPMDEVIAIVDDVAKAADIFYKEYSPYGVYVSKNGYFFEQSSDSYIKVEDLEDFLKNPEHLKESALILYLRPNDLIEINSLSIKPSDNLEIFAAYETKDGFVMASRNNAGGTITREELQKVLEKYNFQHGEVRKVAFNSADFEAIIKAISAKLQNATAFDVRYLYRDDKYAVAVLSVKGNPGQVGQYVLENRNGDWFIIVSNFEKLDKFESEINKQYIDLNLELVPTYKLDRFVKYFRTDYSDVIRAMKLNSYISDSDEPLLFQAGTDDFVYLEFSSGKKFLGNLNKEGTWVMYPITTYEDAVTQMKTLSKDPPLFILKQY